jgi:hypothetical protein
MRLRARRDSRTTASEHAAGSPRDAAPPAESTTEPVRQRTTEPVRDKKPEPGRGTGVAWRTRDAGAAAVGTLGSGVMLLARLVMTVAALIALLIGLAIVLRDVDANGANTIVKGLHESANFFAGSFTGLIAFTGHPKRAITVNWGIALVVYLLVGALISSLIARIGRGGLRFERSHRPVPNH